MFRNRHIKRDRQWTGLEPETGVERRVREPADLGAAIAQGRRTQRLTQAELADIAGIERSRLAKIEAGTSTTLLDQLVHLLDVIGLEITVRPRDPHRGGLG